MGELGKRHSELHSPIVFTVRFNCQKHWCEIIQVNNKKATSVVFVFLFFCFFKFLLYFFIFFLNTSRHFGNIHFGTVDIMGIDILAQ